MRMNNTSQGVAIATASLSREMIRIPLGPTMVSKCTTRLTMAAKLNTSDLSPSPFNPPKTCLGKTWPLKSHTGLINMEESHLAVSGKGAMAEEARRHYRWVILANSSQHRARTSISHFIQQIGVGAEGHLHRSFSPNSNNSLACQLNLVWIKSFSKKTNLTPAKTTWATKLLKRTYQTSNRATSSSTTAKRTISSTNPLSLTQVTSHKDTTRIRTRTRTKMQ